MQPRIIVKSELPVGKYIIPDQFIRSFMVVIDIEDITWPRGDTNFIFEC